MWITVDEVTQFHGLKPTHLNFKDDPCSMPGVLVDWIEQCEDLIRKYTHNDWTDETVPLAVKNVCLRLCSNMITLAIQRRDSPIIKVNDWTIQTTSSDIFTDDLKEDLQPFVKDVSTVSDRIDIFAITGD